MARWEGRQWMLGIASVTWKVSGKVWNYLSPRIPQEVRIPSKEGQREIASKKKSPITPKDDPRPVWARVQALSNAILEHKVRVTRSPLPFPPLECPLPENKGETKDSGVLQERFAAILWDEAHRGNRPPYAWTTGGGWLKCSPRNGSYRVFVLVRYVTRKPWYLDIYLSGCRRSFKVERHHCHIVRLSKLHFWSNWPLPSCVKVMIILRRYFHLESWLKPSKQHLK